MRGVRLLSLAAAAAVLCTAGCAPRRATSAPAAAVAPRRHDPAPRNPDLAGVMERFYQQVEGEHWPFAHAMLSPRYRAVLSEAALRARYASLLAPDVTLRQLDDTTVVARIDAEDRAAPARALHVEETVKLAWDGEDWTIDRITRRDVRARRTR